MSEPNQAGDPKEPSNEKLGVKQQEEQDEVVGSDKRDSMSTDDAPQEAEEPEKRDSSTTQQKDEDEELEEEQENEELVEVELEKPSSKSFRQSVADVLGTIEVAPEEEFPVRWNMRVTAERPIKCFGALCGAWLLSLILLVILSATAGPLEFSLGVPFYDRSEINKEREDSNSAMELEADYVASLAVESSAGECVHQDPTVLTRNGTLINGPAPTSSCQRASSMFLRLIYISKDRTSNMLTPERLEKIKEIEDHILNALELTRYCMLIDTAYPAFETRDLDDIAATLNSTANDDPAYTSCERIFSPLNFFDPLYFDIVNDTGLGYHLLPNDQVIQKYNFSEAFIDKSVSFWSNYTRRTFDLSDFDAAVATVGDTVTIPNLFSYVTSTDFQLGSSEAVGLTSTYSLGLAIDGFESASHDADDQYDEIGQWLWDEFDSYLKGIDIDGVDIYWSDSQGGMSGTEQGVLAAQSAALLPASVIGVLVYLILMQDSFFIGIMGMFQILLSFVPSIIIYRYVFGITYFGFLNLIATYIILGIGVDNIFVFADQFKNYRHEKDFTVRMQKTFNTAARAMFTTSCTTFISFISNAGSAFPAVSTFGVFSAMLVLVNFFAVITFFPAVVSVYYTYIRPVWWDHPFLLFRCKRSVDVQRNQAGRKESGNTEEDDIEVENSLEKENTDAVEGEGEAGDSAEDDSFLVRFFTNTWAPLVIKMRYAIVVFFAIILGLAVFGATQLEPDEEAPNTLPNDNNYKRYTEVLLEYFARSGNPRAIDVYWVSGIDPDDPVDRAGTQLTNGTDYGDVNYVDCSVFNPTTPAAQVWSLQTCHDMFFGNVTEYHGESTDFGPDGFNGPEGRRIVSGVVPMDEFNYYRTVSCVMQGMRDWTLTDSGCEALQSFGLPCHEETATRDNCTTWDVNGNSCEPFPVPAESFGDLLVAFLADPNVDPMTQRTPYARYSKQIFVDEDVDFDSLKVVQDDFSCRTTDDGAVLYALSTETTLDQDFAQNYEDGIELHDKWEAWSTQMRAFAPREMAATMQISNGVWSFYFLNERLLEETFKSIALALGLSLAVLTLVGGNIILACYSVLTILFIVVDVFAFTVLAGWSLGVLEAVNYVVVIGMSIDYCVHMSEAYTHSHGSTREQRVTQMIGHMGTSVLSGALSTLIAAFFMFFAPNFFFVKFAAFLFATIGLSCIYSLTFYPALLSIIGPVGNSGEVYAWINKQKQRFIHDYAKSYVQSTEFVRREEEGKMQVGDSLGA